MCIGHEFEKGRGFRRIPEKRVGIPNPGCTGERFAYRGPWKFGGFSLTRDNGFSHFARHLCEEIAYAEAGNVPDVAHSENTTSNAGGGPQAPIGQVDVGRERFRLCPGGTRCPEQKKRDGKRSKIQDDASHHFVHEYRKDLSIRYEECPSALLEGEIGFFYIEIAFAGVAQLVERQLPKLNVASSTLVARSKCQQVVALRLPSQEAFVFLPERKDINHLCHFTTVEESGV